MKGTLIKLGLLEATAMLPAGAAEVNRSWEKLVESVKVGKSVAVKRTNSVQVEAKLLAIGADTITVQWKKRSEVIFREDVFRVRYANVRRRNTLLAMATGAGAGAVVGAAASTGYTRGGDALGGAAVGGLIFGPITGGVWPIGKPLYEAAVGSKT